MLTLGFYRRREPYYIAHLYYSVHFHTFTFLLPTLFALVSAAGTAGRLIAALWVPLTILYHVKALKRFFDEPWGRTIWKGLGGRSALLALSDLGDVSADHPFIGPEPIWAEWGLNGFHPAPAAGKSPGTRRATALLPRKAKYSIGLFYRLPR